MSNIKIYQVEHEPTGGMIQVQIDHNHISDFGTGSLSMDQLIKKMVDFWSNSKTRLEKNEMSYLNAFLKQLCQECLEIYSSSPNGTFYLIRQFENREGYCSMDGSNGIKILCVEIPDFFDQYKYVIAELPCEEF